MRPYPLTVLKGGINRLRVKGGAAADSLYDLQNGYITNAGSVVPRDGTVTVATLDSSTVGLAAANNQFNIFSSQFSTAALPAGYVLNVLSNPNNTTASPTKIYFAKPFMGFEYVVAGFSDGSVFHYWLQNSGTWTSSTDYTSASIVLPPVANGLAYQGVRDFPVQPLWTPNTIITSGSYVEPNEPTGFAYQAVLVTGSPVHTGQVEPVWPTVAGGIVQEFGDFDLSTTDAGTTQQSNSQISTASPLASSITDRYGDSSTVANSGIFTSSSTLSASILASTKITTWKGGTNYAPGAVVVPTSNQGAFVNAIPNGDFEGGSGAGGWTFTDPGGTIQWAYSNVLPYQGSECISVPGGAGMGAQGAYATMTGHAAVTPGQSVTATAYLDPNNSGANLTLWLQINWYDHGDSIISSSGNQKNEQEGGGYRQVSVTGTAPAGAAFARVSIGAGSGTNSRNAGFADLVSWNLATPAPITNFLFEAVQPAAASSAATEPTWPTVLGNEVIDGGVTWKAIGTSIINWQAIPLMQSGLTAPTFPTTIGNAVHDFSTYSNINGYVTTFSSMSWEAVDRHISDPKDPNSIAVAIGASHVFAGSNDIVPYSAAVNPTDWSSSNNAGYLPTGLNNYGDNPVTALALYRGNLIVFNAGGYQMWQIDPDPQNMAFLDAQPVGSIWPRAAQSVANDLLFLTEVGVRNLGTIGATANMAIGNTGQQVDPLILAQIQAGTYDPFSIYYPGRGQYWLIYGPQVFVLTINGMSGTKTWSRYIFPQPITDATLLNGFLYLRTAGNLVWQVNAQAGTDSGITMSTDANTFLLIHFDAQSGSGAGFINTPDASQYANLVYINTVFAALTAASPKFGAESVSAGSHNYFDNYAVQVPYSGGSHLDIFTSDEWTFEGWIKITSAGGGGLPAWFCAYGDDAAGGIASTFNVYAIPTGDGATAVWTMNDYSNWGTNRTPTSVSVALATNTWYHIAVVSHAGTVTLYQNGTAIIVYSNLSPAFQWIPANYTHTGATTVCLGSFSRLSQLSVPVQIDEFRVSGYAVYTADFVPPTAPFALSGGSVITSGTPFNGVMQWPYLDMGTIGRNKMMVGLDLVGEGNCSVQVASNQADKSTFNDNPGFATSTGVTAPYFVTVDDTVPGQPIPIPIMAPSISLILTFTGSTSSPNNWSWEAANIYVADATGAGAMG